MKMKITAYRLLLVAFALLGAINTGNGQQYNDSLLSYLEISAKNNPEVQIKFTEYQASLQLVPQAGSLSDPELSLGVFLKPMELVAGNQIADLRLMQMFPWFGVLRNAKDEVSLMANAKYEIFRDAKLQLFYDVQRDWYELFKIRKEITVSEKNIEILRVIEQLSTVRFKSSPSGSTESAASGSGLADLYRIQIEAGDLQNNIALLESKEQSVSARFNSYLNRPPVTPVFTGADLVVDSLSLPLAAVSDSINAKNPRLSMLEFEKQSYAARKKMVSGMGFPMVGIGLNYSLIGKNEMSSSSMNGKDMIMPMVSVTLPIYRKKYVAMQKEADLLAQAAAQNYQATANSLQNEYFQAVQLYLDAKRRAKLYGDQYNLASKSLDLILKSFSASTSGLTDVLRVHQQTLDYELKEVEAVADFNTAVAWLNRLMAFSQIK
jgi:outer membrane protein TolC